MNVDDGHQSAMMSKSARRRQERYEYRIAKRKKRDAILKEEKRRKTAEKNAKLVESQVCEIFH